MGDKKQTGWILIFSLLALSPCIIMILLSVHTYKTLHPVYTFNFTPLKVSYDRCEPFMSAVRGQLVNGQDMFQRDKRILLSQCWEDS